MKELSIIKETMSSIEIAALVGMNHKDVLRAIRNMEESWAKVAGRNFALSEYKDSTGRTLPMYELTRTECLYIATKFNDEARAKLILRWEQLENEKQSIQVPGSFKEALLLAAQQQEQIEEQQKRIASQAPAVHFTESVTCSGTNILIRDLAKLLCQNGHDIGEVRLYEWLVYNKYLILKKRWIKKKQKYMNDYMSTQKAAELKVFFVSETTISTGEIPFIKHSVKVTGKGQVYFINKFKSKTTEE